jgi:radical SAM modification target selenobiotic family peptide
MKKQHIKKALAGLSIAALAAGIGMMPGKAEAGCMGKGSCGSGSCGSRAGMQARRSMTSAADSSVNPVCAKNKVGTDKGIAAKSSCGKGSCGKGTKSTTQSSCIK